MRCFIYYKRGPSCGMAELDVSGKNDPRIKVERSRLERAGAVIYRMEIW